MNETWIFPCNTTSEFRLHDFFSSHKSIDWHQGNRHINVGDIVYIYASSSEQAIRYKCIVTRPNKQVKTIDDHEYYLQQKSEDSPYVELELVGFVNDISYKKLLSLGLKGPIQGSRRIKDNSIIDFIQKHESIFNQNSLDDINVPRNPLKSIKKNSIIYYVCARCNTEFQAAPRCPICGQLVLI